MFSLSLSGVDEKTNILWNGWWFKTFVDPLVRVRCVTKRSLFIIIIHHVSFTHSQSRYWSWVFRVLGELLLISAYHPIVYMGSVFGNIIFCFYVATTHILSSMHCLKEKIYILKRLVHCQSSVSFLAFQHLLSCCNCLINTLCVILPLYTSSMSHVLDLWLGKQGHSASKTVLQQTLSHSSQIVLESIGMTQNWGESGYHCFLTISPNLKCWFLSFSGTANNHTVK